MKFSDIIFFDNPFLDIVVHGSLWSFPYVANLEYHDKLKSMQESFSMLIKNLSVFSLSIFPDKISLTLVGELDENLLMKIE